MSAKPATIYLGTRSHFRRRIKAGPLKKDGHYRNLLKRSMTNGVFHRRQLVKKAKSTNSTSKPLWNKPGNKMTTSVLHLPTDLAGPKSVPASSQQQQQTQTANVKPGLPSPSTSETSDYQRSTPSPGNEDQFRALSSSEFDWTSHTNDLCSSTTVTTTNNSDCKSSTNLNNFPSNQQRRKSTSSLMTPTTNNHHNHTTDNNISNSNTKISNSNLVLQQLRVALKKLPESAKLTKKPLEAVKRRHSDCGPAFNGVETGSGAVSGSKKPKWAQGHGHHRRPFSASMGKGQGKITEYLPEMKHFIAMRKEKLDRVLNLGRKEVDLLSRQLSETSVKNDTLDISASCSTSSTPKKANSESGVETGSNDTASVASSGSRHSLSSGIASRDEDVFEVPRTIRFPPAAPTKCYSEVVICKWELCGNEFDSTGKLLDHLKTVHAVAENQKDETDSTTEETGSQQYKCLWEGCKVYGKGSSSKLWLEKHVMSHGGNKPFQCIVDGCKHRFGTQTLLERHVNNHFKNNEALNGSGSNSKNGSNSEKSGTGNGKDSKSGNSVQSSNPASRSSASNQSTGYSSKLIKKLIGKKLRYRKTPYSARILDVFDIGSMAKVRMNLSHVEQKCQVWKSTGHLENPHLKPNQVVILHSKIIARRTDMQGNHKVLQSWEPPNIIEDQWVLAKDFVPIKRVTMSSLPPKARVQLNSQLYNCPQMPSRCRKLRPQPRSTALS